MKISYIKIKELAKITGLTPSVVSKYFKDAGNDEVLRNNNRVTGVSPEAAHKFLTKNNISFLDKGGVVLSANLCGGVGKTSGVYSLACCLRRMVSRDTPIVIVDTDSQGSLTSSIFGEPASNDEAILVDYLEGRVKTKDILMEAENNIWCVKSNLNQVYIDKVLSKPTDIKNKMKLFYQDIFANLGSKTIIFQDHTPQLSSVFASSVCALFQMGEDYFRVVVIPVRSDRFAIDGAEKILQEIQEIKETFNLNKDIDIHCYFSSIDKRISTTSGAIKAAQKNTEIIKHLSPVVVRYCVEIPKSIQSASNVYSSGKANKAAEDYLDLLLSIFIKEDD